MKYLYSTMSSDNDYIIYVKNEANGSRKADGKVTIKGKSNVADPKTFITPNGALTELQDSEYALIENNTHLKKHIEKGFVKVSSKKLPIKEAVKGMKAKDKSAQKTPKDFKDLKAEVVKD